MNDLPAAFHISPVPAPGPDAVAPPVFRGIYGMPMFVTIPTADLPASVDFWTRGLGFFDLFGIPGQMMHLRRWAFQDVLLVAGPRSATAPAVSVSFACVLDQIEPIAEALRAVGADVEPRDTAWNTRDIEVITPENARVIFTAAKVFDPDSVEGRNLRAVGIDADDNESHV
ncbi:VOC family protein [Microbacterium sp. SORGH_AS_0888]|uniref:VOC family protein n=1 Tax=Microbacterium sp. SORGH_AS_0888 TaxID=3041791 RepID=UPI0027828024|nr:VOC family protein [Microbacterium sp. SORGH_AS_0888]MDQ1130101.1 catechol 2,3-dioxygenase-like lactoylglutathione lyase family enzyme [Microbacterium sp. SORGH_AS_0888]